MIREFLLFDMDGVLLKPGGYHQSLRTSINRIGKALGIPNVILSHDQIARFEALSVTNEWDSLAICTAFLLVNIWQMDGDIRLHSLEPRSEITLNRPPNFDKFLDIFTDISQLPGDSAFDLLMNEYTWINGSQRIHLSNILHRCRDISQSPTLPGYQETVLGSDVFQKTYGLKPQLNIESFLDKFDSPVLTNENHNLFRRWLSDPGHAAGVITNRPCLAPDGYLSSPEAELGAKLVNLEDIPILGSGILGWYAGIQNSLPDHSLLKPHPIHALGLLVMCMGKSTRQALDIAAALIRGEGNRDEWSQFDCARVVIFEDSLKGLMSGVEAKSLLSKIDIEIDLELIGVSDHPVKRQTLSAVTDNLCANLNEFNWKKLSR